MADPCPSQDKTPLARFDMVFTRHGKTCRMPPSLLNRFPDTDLAQMAPFMPEIPVSSDYEFECLEYMLEYIRDGKVMLPYDSLVTKEFLLEKFEKHGFGNTNDILSNAIHTLLLFRNSNRLWGLQWILLISFIPWNKTMKHVCRPWIKKSRTCTTNVSACHWNFIYFANTRKPTVSRFAFRIMDRTCFLALNSCF